jgi:hypothetical protein
LEYAAGEAKYPPLRPTFDRRIKLEFHVARITTDCGLLAYRELDDALGLSDMAITKLLDGRRGKSTRHELSGSFRQPVFGRFAGYEMSTMLSGSPAAPPGGRPLAVTGSIVRQRPAARWGASRPRG